MKLSKIKHVLLLVAISFLLIAANFTGNKDLKNQSGNNDSLNILNLPTVADIHIPIWINSNAELATFVADEELSGNGTYASPYIIENFDINASTANGIEIRNTDAYLIIRNCRIESGNSTGNVGIYLYNTANVNLSNNEVIDNFSGIHLSDSSNNTLSGNTANFNYERGIYLSDSSNNTLSGNTADNNYWCGINLEYSSNNILSGNNVGYNKDHGILLWYSNNCTLSENNANYNAWIGIHLEYSSNNTLFGNTADYNTWCGIYLYHMSNNTLSGNNVGFNFWGGIHLDNSSNNTLLGNFANNNEKGIVLWHSSNNNTLSMNDASYNTWNGILLWNMSNNNTLSGNYVNYNNEVGINLENSRINTLFENNVNNNVYGIYLKNSSNNIISKNDARHCTQNGIEMWNSSNNILSENNANYNEKGFFLNFCSNNNTLSGNIASYNTQYGIYLRSSSNNNTLSENNINNNEYGIYLELNSNNNTIYLNDIYGNQNAQAYEKMDCIDNQWDNGTTGNFWGNDYIIKYPDATNDGYVWGISYKIDGLSEGIDNFPLVNSKFPDIEAPQFTDFSKDFSSDEGYSSLSITWTIIDLHSSTYTILLDGIEIVSATTWISGNVISYNIPDGLLKDNYNITIIASDESGNIAQKTIIFSVNINDSINDGEFKIPGFPLVHIITFNSIGVIILTLFTSRKKKKKGKKK